MVYTKIVRPELDFPCRQFFVCYLKFAVALLVCRQINFCARLLVVKSSCNTYTKFCEFVNRCTNCHSFWYTLSRLSFLNDIGKQPNCLYCLELVCSFT